MNKKIFASLLLTIFLISLIPSLAISAELDLESKSAVLIEATTGQVIYEKMLMKKDRRPVLLN